MGGIGNGSPIRASIRSLLACVCLGVVALAFAGRFGRGRCELHEGSGPAGDDSAAGNTRDPYATARRLVGSLAPGQTGCLRAGVYEQGELTLATPAPG